MKDIAVSLQKVVTNAAIKDTPMISVPVPTALPYFGISSSLTFLRLLGMYCADIPHYVHDSNDGDEYA